MDPGPVHKRRRPAVACTECRRRKIACDLENPCGPCLRSNGNLRCVYNNYNPGRNNNDRVHHKKGRRDRGTSNASNESSHHTVASPARSQFKFGAWPSEAQLAEPQEPQDTLSAAAHMAVAPSKTFQVADVYEHLPEQPEMLSLTNLEQMTDSFEIEMQAFISDSELVFPEDSLLAAVATSGSSWPNSVNPANSLHQQAGSMIDLNDGRCSATAITKNEPPLDVSCDDIRALLRQVANKHDGGASGEVLLTGGDCMLAQRLAQMTSNTEQQARQEQQPHQQELGVAQSNLDYHGGQLSSTTHNVLPVKTVRDALLNAYFFAFESVIYILDPTCFLKIYESFWSRPRSQLTGDDDVVACKILAAVSIGCCIHPNLAALEQSPQSLRTDEGLRCANEWLRRRMAEGCRLEPIDVAQILCLLALARHLQERQFGPGGAGRLLENYDPTRVGMQLGFHREALYKNTALRSTDIESRRMIWATMVEICIQASLDEGLPPPIYPESYDCELPGTTSAGDALSASSSIIGHLARTQRPRLQALHILNSPGSSATHEQCSQLATDLERACREGVGAIRKARLGGSLTVYQVKSLEASIYPFIMNLHSRFIAHTPSDPEMYYSRCVRMECAARLLRHTLGQRSSLRATACSYGPLHLGQHHEAFQHQLGTDDLYMSHGSDTLPVGTMRVLPWPRSDSRTSVSSSSSGLPPSSAGPPPDVQDPYISLCLRGNGHALQVQRQATAMLFLDVIDDLDEERFDILHGAVRQELLSLLRNSLALFQRRMRLAFGAHSTREYVVFTSAAAYVDALIDRQGSFESDGGDSLSVKERDIDTSIAQATMIALDVCSQAARKRSSSSTTQSS